MFRIIQPFFRYMTRDKDILYVLCPYSLGDFLMDGGLCHALLKKKHKQICVLIVQERFEHSGLNFVGVTEVRSLPKEIMYLICQYVYATREYETDNYVFGQFKKTDQGENWNGGLVWNEKLSIVDRLKENVFDLPLDTEVIPPIIPPPNDLQKQRLNELYVLDKERTIILAPYTNSVETLQESFWVNLVQRLKQKNKDYIFYTNVASPQEKVIPGTAPIVTTFPELIYLAEKVNCFIGHRSGIFDLLAFTNAKLLYINKDIRGWWFYEQVFIND